MSESRIESGTNKRFLERRHSAAENSGTALARLTKEVPVILQGKGQASAINHQPIFASPASCPLPHPSKQKMTLC